MNMIGKLIISLLVVLSTPKALNYISIPITRQQNATHTAHNLILDINQHIYRITMHLHGQHQAIIELGKGKTQQKSSNPDYRKRQDSIYGVLDYYACRRVDTRLPIYRQVIYNVLNYGWDLMGKQQWLGLKNTKQIKQAEWIENMSDGRVSMSSPLYSNLLTGITHYNSLAKHKIFSLRMDESGSSGWAAFGAFPTEMLKNAKSYARVKVDNSHQQKWVLNVAGLGLIREGSGQTIPLFSLPTKFKISISEKTLQMPTQAIVSLSSMLEGCQLRQIGTERLFTCRQSSVKQYSSFKIAVNLTNSKITIDYPLKNLLRSIKNDQAIFNIRQGRQDEFHLSALMLQDYAIGLDYEGGWWMFGHKRTDLLLDRFIFLKIFAIVNLFLFIGSLVVVVATRKEEENKGVQQLQQMELSSKSKYYNTKSLGYEMAVGSEISPRDIQQATDL